RRLLIMAVIAFLLMFILMYAMIDVLGNLYVNLNQFYMAGLMTGPMVLLELILMRSMYTNRRWNALIVAASLIASLTFFVFIRQQVGVSDREFLRSMIPHHASAILMCESASVQDPQIVALCDDILSSQQEQIDQMKAKLAELSR
ncbi:MAG TPA: DUF305 domain-containing protein, partial [Anaerolineales bacterium]